MQQQIRTLQVSEEFVSETDALARPFDQAGYVGHRELPRGIRSVHGAEDGCKRREGILRDLRLRIRDPRQQRGLSGVRKPDERRVCQQFQAKVERRFLAGQAGFREPRCTARRRGETLVAPTWASAARCDHAGSRRREIGDDLLLLVEHLGSDGDAKLE